MIVAALLSVLGGLIWSHIVAFVLLRENYDLGTDGATITVVVCIIPTLVLGLIAFVGWFWTLVAVVQMVVALVNSPLELFRT